MAKKLGSEFAYDLSEFRRVDPNLIHYEEAEGLATGMKEPRGMAVGPHDVIYLAGDRIVRALDGAGKTCLEFRTDQEPQRVAARTGALYVAMKDHVEVFDAAGNRQAAWAPAGKDALLVCVAAGDADVFVADANGRAVIRYDLAGRVVNRIDGRMPPDSAAKDADDSGFIVPSPYFDVAIGPAGKVWIANPGRRRVELHAYDGRLIGKWGAASFRIEGFCGCCNPTHLAVLADGPSPAVGLRPAGGSLVTSEKGLPRVKVYNADGNLRSVVAPPTAFDEGTAIADLAADSTGRILVLDPDANKVRIFTRKKSAPATEAKS
jgi:hypothetical protein